MDSVSEGVQGFVVRFHKCMQEGFFSRLLISQAMPPTEVAEPISIPPSDAKTEKSGKVYKKQIIWFNATMFALLHLLALNGLRLAWQYPKTPNFWIGFWYSLVGGIGITAGYHRYWCHRTYKAKLPLRIFLMFLSGVAGQEDIFLWVRDHRLHHKYTDTDADPYNISRGFFFAHMGWLMCRKHPEVLARGKEIDMSDVLADPVVRFQRKYYFLIATFFVAVVPTLFCMYVLGYPLAVSFCYYGLFRYTLMLHSAWTVNSLAHYYGYKPYDNGISSVENVLVGFLANGEGFHNYHHTFPYDYSTSELSYYFNVTTLFIDFMAYIGQAYDRRRADISFVKAKTTWVVVKEVLLAQVDGGVKEGWIAAAVGRCPDCSVEVDTECGIGSAIRCGKLSKGVWMILQDSAIEAFPTWTGAVL
ncbi:SCD [Cordylochernes scorpioides]|uniref:SCD n=1 Tax=Cordylochernes scorpioides TaxID=51811 RepID=A0ABY6LJ23_9ARAC|nr:SCD [Cordylochernes scorpioides]